MISLKPSLLCILSFLLISTPANSKNDRKTYIVYMGDHPKGVDPTSLPSLHMAMAKQVLGSDFEAGAILHSYKESFNGFVIKLTQEEAEKMKEMDNVVSVFLNTKLHPHTTRSWDFIGFPQQVNRTNLESDVIVGVIDTGIWPESKSFNDEGFGPPPKKWKGSCHNFPCNNKIIGAKYFNIGGEYGEKDNKSARDTNGHGTHCASTVAGIMVNSTSLLGYGSGTARGGVPSARIAVYKALWEGGGSEASVLAAFDAAIADGVDIISISVGPTNPIFQPYFHSSYSIGSFQAMKRDILTSQSAGNDGPSVPSTTSLAPWLLSVAASTFARDFVTKVKLGDGAIFEGSSINTFDLENKMFPLIYAGDVPNTAGGFNSSISKFCFNNSVDKDSVKGKIVLCEGILSPPHLGLFPGAVGVIFGSVYPNDGSASFAKPATILSQARFKQVHSYKTSSNPIATIFKSDEVKDSLSPRIASFSSRGPNPITPNILKPDIAAPGVNVLAAWSPLNPISEVQGDTRAEQYNIISGTSMACPHVTAAAAYVKSFHPNWSPAMIKSALMTTATPMSSALDPEAEFAYGAGQINPLQATNPGLVYDISEADYVQFLCGEGYSDKMLQSLTKDESSCKGKANRATVYNLNLPSFALSVNNTIISYVFHRTVTNVGSATSTYNATVISPSLLDIQVNPNNLSFTSIGQKKSFTVTIEGRLNVQQISSSLTWGDGKFQVRSPIIVYYAGLAS